MKILSFFLFLWVIFALLDPDLVRNLYADPDPDPTAQINADPCGSGSETLLINNNGYGRPKNLQGKTNFK
jgi:hypothetical protein